MEKSIFDSFCERDLVFAQATGYVPWPGILTKKLPRAGEVLFMCTNDSKSIPYEKIWPYDDHSKERFITHDNMEYEEFREAICIAEKLQSGDVDIRSEGAGWQLVSPLELLPRGARSPFQVPRQANWGLKYVRQVRMEVESLSVEVRFIKEINALRSSLTLRNRDFPSALRAFQELQELALSELLLVRNFGAVEAVYRLCRFASAHPQFLLEAEQVRSLAKQLMARFALHFKQPFSSSNFWSEYCLRSGTYRNYTVDIK
ncbi:uncharacterized protein LOC108098669 [Drosophila ficusphila]|uniref:uncharacterized protein LOC108098669 n=1 Tax=Drosophila ficusphila TaxID=30025 RepID=UPI0007E6C2A0|nr:uncharacterized protein LOC108098669 [Drosophila ficusphila]